MLEVTVRPNGGEIKLRRKAKKWTQDVLATKAGVCKHTVENAEAGKRVKEDNLQCMAEALDTPYEDLLLPDAPAAQSPECIHAIDLYELHISVRPTEPTDHCVKHGTTTRTVSCDNLARIKRTVVFAETTRCTKPFTLRYSTRAHGYVSLPLVSGPNLQSPEEKGLYDDYGTQVVFRFLPTPGRAALMAFDIYKGFDAGQRSVHFHLPKDAHYAQVRIILDLAGYLTQGDRISLGPHFCLHPADPDNHDVCGFRDYGALIQPKTVDGSGVWCWEVMHLDQGVVDLYWDLQIGL